jgi:hypothetical protein
LVSAEADKIKLRYEIERMAANAKGIIDEETMIQRQIQLCASGTMSEDSAREKQNQDAKNIRIDIDEMYRRQIE